MNEHVRPPIPFMPPNIPSQEGALRIDPTTGRGRIDTLAAYKGMAAFSRSSDNIIDPVSSDDPYGNRFISFMSQFVSLQAGSLFRRNVFSLEPVPSWPQKFPSTDTTSIVGRLENQPVILRHATEPTNLVLLDEPIQSNFWNIGHARDMQTGKEKAIRTGFLNMEELEDELVAIHTLSELGYPVPQNASSHQFLLPWIDTVTYDWVPGKDLSGIFTELILNGYTDQANSIAKLFGQHLKQVWEPLLEEPLPNGTTYRFPDNAFGNFIYTGNQSSRKAFVRIDVGELSKNSFPLGSKNYLAEIARETTSFGEDISSIAPTIDTFSERLMHNIREGFSEG